MQHAGSGLQGREGGPLLRALHPLVRNGACLRSGDIDRHAKKQRMERRLLKTRLLVFVFVFFPQKNILAEKKCLPKVAKYFKNILIAFLG